LRVTGWLLALDSAVLAAIGVSDFVRGEAGAEAFAVSYALGLAALASLPLPARARLVLFAGHAALLAVLYALHRWAAMGTLDFLVSPHLPVAAAVATPLGAAAGVAAAAAVYLLHAARALRVMCRPAPPGVVTLVHAERARRAWYVVPPGLHPEREWDKAAEAKEAWSGGCVEGLVGIPLVAVYAAFHAAVVALYLL